MKFHKILSVSSNIQIYRINSIQCIQSLLISFRIIFSRRIILLNKIKISRSMYVSFYRRLYDSKPFDLIERSWKSESELSN